MVAGLIQEFFRISFPEVIVQRDDWLLAREHIHVLSSLLYRLLVESNAPLPPMGVKQWSAKLTPAQVDALAHLPTDARNVDELRDAHVAIAALFVPNAEVLAERLGVAWPGELEAAATAHVREVLGVEDPFPRSGPVIVAV